MKFITILIYFLKDEIKLNLRRVKIIYIFFKEFSIFRLFIYLFNDSVIPCRDKIFRNFIIKNTKRLKNKNNSNKKKILITNILDHAGYTTTEIIVGKNLEEILNAESIGLINNYSFKNILLFKSFGIKKILVLRNLNIFARLKYFIQAYLIIKSCKNMEEFLNFNINNIEIGKGVYDHYLRFSGVGTTNEFKAEFYIYLSKCLLIYHQINKHFKNYKFIASVQSEQMFIPGSIIFQTALVNGANVYSRVGLGKSFTVRRYTNINERYHARDHFSKKLYDFVNKNIRKEAIEIGGEIIKKRFEGLPEYQKKNLFYNLPKFRKIKKKFMEIKRKNITKEDLCVRLAWSPKTSIGVIFATDLTDGVFQTSWSLFRDRLTWLRETLLEVKNINSVNWLLKPHPNDEKNKVVTDTISEYKKICSNYKHILPFPNDVSTASIPKFVHAVITMGGSASYEYPCFGIPVFQGSESICSGRGFTIDPGSKKEYFDLA